MTSTLAVMGQALMIMGLILLVVPLVFGIFLMQDCPHIWVPLVTAGICLAIEAAVMISKRK